MQIFIKRLCGMWLVPIFFFLINSAVVSQSYKSLFPCFIDLPGWEAEEAFGMDPNDWIMTTGAKRDLITASRDYEKDTKSLSVVIEVGPGIAALYAEMEESESNSGGMHTTVKNIKGHQAHISCHLEDETNCCDIRIVLFSGEESGALLMFTSEGLTEKEALEIAQKFDWDLMTEKAKSLEFHSQ